MFGKKPTTTPQYAAERAVSPIICRTASAGGAFPRMNELECACVGVALARKDLSEGFIEGVAAEELVVHTFSDEIADGQFEIGAGA